MLVGPVGRHELDAKALEAEAGKKAIMDQLREKKALEETHLVQLAQQAKSLENARTELDRYSRDKVRVRVNAYNGWGD